MKIEERVTILIVDDEQANLHPLFDYLKGENFKTLVATGGERAIRLLDRSQPDIILLDVMMPGIDGFQTCRHLKEMETTRDIPVIFMTGLTETVDKVKGFEAGAVDYLTKPLQHAEVLARVNAHLTIRKFQRQLQEQNVLLQQKNALLEQQKEQIRESEERFRGLSEATFEGILIHAEGHVIEVNQAILDMFGYQRADIIGKNALTFLTPKFRDMALERIRAHNETPYEADGIRRDCSILPLEIQAKTMPYQGRDVRVAAIRDLTWRKAMEEEKARLQEEKLAFTMETLGFVTHELKSPLGAMQSMIAVMLDGFTGEMPDEIGRFLLRIRRNCEELQDMVKNYLDFSRVGMGKLIVKKSSIDYHKEVVEPCIEQTQVLFDSRCITLVVTSPETLTVLADPALLRIALTNYLTNAAKYGAENTQATLTVVKQQGIIATSVLNEGAGFSQAEQAMLFAKFSRLKNENTIKKRGSGLGLYLTKYILELHEGNVWAESVPGHWAKFYFSFPLNSEPE